MSINYTKNGTPYVVKSNVNSKVIGFDRVVSFRIREDDFKQISKIVSKNQDLFYNESHFVRSSILKNIREFNKNGVRLKK